MIMMMEESVSRQMLVKGLDGGTLCLRFEGGDDGILTGGDVKAVVSERTGIPLRCLRLVTGTAVVSDELSFAGERDDGLPSCTVLLRLPGGKGGFGSLLRGAATKAGQKKTSNFDACRDMSGRRLRHVNAEKKLKEWKAEAEERELEKTAEEFLKKEKKAKEEDSGVFEELARYRAETSKNMEEVGLAVASGLVEARKLDAISKRKVEEEAAVAEKRARIWLGDEDEEDESDAESMDEDERPSSSGEAGDEDVAVATAEQVEPAPGRSSPSSQVAVVNSVLSMNEAGSRVGTIVEDVVVEMEVKNTVSTDRHSSEKVTMQSETITKCNESVDGYSSEKVTTQSETIMKSTESADGHSSEKVTIRTDTVTVAETHVKGEALEKIENGGEMLEVPIMEIMQASQELKVDKTSGSIDNGPVNFEVYQSAEEMQGLGMEKLKTELQSRGLKCGGSLSERAGRLFLLKSTPLEKLDKKHFTAKTKAVKK